MQCRKTRDRKGHGNGDMYSSGSTRNRIPAAHNEEQRETGSECAERGMDNKADFTKQGHEGGHAAAAGVGSGGGIVLLHRSEDHQPFVIGEGAREGGEGA